MASSLGRAPSSGIARPPALKPETAGADKAYRQATLPDQAPRLAIEAGVSDYWRKYVGLSGAVVGIDAFGESAPAEVLFDHVGFTVANVVKAVEALVKP